MATEIPEYKRRRQITPAADTVGAKSAVAGSIDAYNALSAFGATVASNAGRERMAMSGYEAGSKPGAKLTGVAVTPLDKTYEQAFLESSSQTLANNANQFLNELNLTFAKNPNPTAGDLATYQSEAAKGLSSIIDSSDPRIKNQLKTQFNRQLESNLYNQAQKVNQTDLNNLKSIYAEGTRNNYNDIYNNFRAGLNVNATEAYQAQVQNLEANRYLIGEKAYNEGIEAAKLTYFGAKHEAEMLDIYQNQGQAAANKYLQDFMKNKQVGLDDADKENILPSLYNRLSREQSLNSLNDNLLLEQAKRDVMMSPSNVLSSDQLSYYRENLSDLAFERLQNSQLQQLQENQLAIGAANFMLENAGNALALSQLTENQKDKAYESIVNQRAEQLERPLTLEEERDIAASFDTPIPAFNKRLNAAINSINPEMAHLGAQIYNSLQSTRPRVDNAAATRAMAIAKQTDAGASPLDAYKYVSEKMDGVTPTEQQARKAMFNSYLKDYKITDGRYEKQREFVAKKLGFPTEMMTGSAQSRFMNAFEREYVRANDIDVAIERATEEVLRTTSISNANGIPTVMDYAPDKVAPLEVVQEQMQASLDDYLGNLKSRFNEDDAIGFYYEKAEPASIDEQTRLQFGLDEELAVQEYQAAQNERNKFKYHRINRNGDKVTGYLMIRADEQTERRETQEIINKNGQRINKVTPQSYSWIFVPEDFSNISLLTDVRDFSNARFYFKYDEYADEQRQLNQEKMQAAKRFTDLRRDTLNQINNKYYWFNPIKWGQFLDVYFYPERFFSSKDIPND